MNLTDLAPQAVVDGFLPGILIEVVATVPMGPSAVNLVYKRMDTKEITTEVVISTDPRLATMQIAVDGRPWSFTAPGEPWRLAVEAKRIGLAWLFEPMMAVYTSKVDPLPHQILAVYESMLPRQPLRFLLADDPGAGKTVMAGLYIRELMLRADARRILIVAPGSLTPQWGEEMIEKFGLLFEVFDSSMIQNTATGNPFAEKERLVVRLDQLSRNPMLQEKLKQAPEYDLIVVDEAHKMSAQYWGGELRKTARFELGELLAGHCRHFLLMTATPHNGKEEDFQAFLTLLDGDRFYGKMRDGTRRVDVSDIMRRMVKEELVRFDGTPLFPDRIASTVNYKLSDDEASLYAQVTDYVRNGMNRAARLDDSRRVTVGFAMTSLQRRLASSPAAIWESLKRRKRRLEDELRENRLQNRGNAGQSEFIAKIKAMENADWDDYADPEDDLDDEVNGTMTVAETIEELQKEILDLDGLIELAESVYLSNRDSKWARLRELLESEEIRGADGRPHQLILFTEHRDTLNYLVDKLRDKLDLVGEQTVVEAIHGGTARDVRKTIQERFRFTDEIKVLVATDAAGEGVNLQSAHLLINYDLPWNPNRLEQRFGRIHRIGQQEICHMWNLVASETREGQVWETILAKIEREKAALGGKVFDILGQVFEETPLHELLRNAILDSESEEATRRRERTIDNLFDPEKLKAILERRALTKEVMGERLGHLRESMERAEARKMQPYYVQSFFLQAFPRLKGEVRTRENNRRWEIVRVPAALIELDRLKPSSDPLLRKYERICFEREHLRVPGKLQEAKLIHPGHPLVARTIDSILEQDGPLLEQGAVMVDPTDCGEDPWLLFLLEHAIEEGRPDIARRTIASRRVQFVKVFADGRSAFAGWAPHLDLRPMGEGERRLVQDVLHAPWIVQGAQDLARNHAMEKIVPEHRDEVVQARAADVAKTLEAVHERLSAEITYWSARSAELRQEIAAGKDARLTVDNIERRVDELSARLDSRTRELIASKELRVKAPEMLGVALVIPQGLLDLRSGEATPASPVDAEARRRVEILAMDAVSRDFRERGFEVRDVSADKCGWDLTMIEPATEAHPSAVWHVEVKGREAHQDTVTVTHNEIVTALNQKDKFLLAIVPVDQGRVVATHYIPKPFEREPEFDDASINKSLPKLLERAVALDQILSADFAETSRALPKESP